MSLENAPDDVKLAVDLIVLLEENQLPAQTVLRALEIVKRDYENKLKTRKTPRKAIKRGLVRPHRQCQSLRRDTMTTDSSWNDFQPRRMMRYFGNC